MFVSVWIAFLLTGIAMAVLTVLWSVRTGQFEEQDRARFLPLGDLSPEELAAPRVAKRSPAFYANLAILAAGLGALAVTTVVVCRHL
jgi:nitrogen fixation-related uncharacterized protein